MGREEPGHAVEGLRCCIDYLITDRAVNMDIKHSRHNPQTGGVNAQSLGRGVSLGLQGSDLPILDHQSATWKNHVRGNKGPTLNLYAHI